MPELNLDGYTELPAGKIAAVVTYLEMTSPPSRPAGDAPAGFSLERQQKPDVEEYRKVFRAVGERWLWFSRLNLSDEDLRAALSRPGVSVWWLKSGASACGLLELDESAWPDVEVVYLGVTPELVGQGAGAWMFRRGLEEVWSRNPRRIWLHTCTLDHPAALGFYVKHGFRPYRRAIEVADDPRLTGRLPVSSAPHVPIL